VVRVTQFYLVLKIYLSGVFSVLTGCWLGNENQLDGFPPGIVIADVTDHKQAPPVVIRNRGQVFPVTILCIGDVYPFLMSAGFVDHEQLRIIATVVDQEIVSGCGMTGLNTTGFVEFLVHWTAFGCKQR
jgi:hypothetical protein